MSSNGTVLDELTVVRVGGVAGETLRHVADAIETQLGVRPRIHPDPVSLDAVDTLDNSDQYDATTVAHQPAEVAEDVPTLAVTDVDITEGDRNYVFGATLFGWNAAVLSTYRLETGNDAFVEGDPFVERVRKQAVLHAGQIAGMDVCYDGCVFQFSPTVRELDLKDESPCADCQEELAQSVGDTGGDPASETPVDHGATGSEEPANGTSGGGTGEMLLHDLSNTVRFWGWIAGFGLCFLLSAVLFVPVVEFVLGPVESLSSGVVWGLLVVLLLMAYVGLKLLKWVVFGAGSVAKTTLRLRAQE